jgi:phage shock protein C
MRLPHDRFSLFRDTENGLLMGVCAGLADYLDTNVLLVRVVMVLLLASFTIPVALIYLTAGVLLRERPLRYRGQAEERWFWGGRRGGV